MKVDLEKLICSLFKQVDRTGYKLRMSNLIKALKEQGIKYKDGKLTQIENEPKFKVGQTIIYKGTENIAPTKMTISDIAKGQYWDDNCCIVPISDQNNWELEKPTTIKFNVPDIEDGINAMVNEFFWTHIDTTISSHTRAMMEEAYRQGLEDMYKRLKG